jgi:hypothetical protein
MQVGVLDEARPWVGHPGREPDLVASLQRPRGGGQELARPGVGQDDRRGDGTGLPADQGGVVGGNVAHRGVGVAAGPVIAVDDTAAAPRRSRLPLRAERRTTWEGLKA